jgi:hypothetical protein
MNDFESENDKLLEEVQTAEEHLDKVEITKSNSKKALIDKIKLLCEKQNITLGESDTKLNRMNKADLGKLLAKKIEQTMQQQILQQANFKNIESTGLSNSREILALSTLKIGLHCINNVIERGAGYLLDKGNTNLTIDGFSQNFKQPEIDNEVNECLKVIIAEHPDIISQISSPYIRLLLVYGTVVAQTIQKKPRQFKCTKVSKSDN